MTDTPRRRGRPKGTGINDTVSLAAIARLIAADGTLKPTTAIHRVGVTDPSAVRRLRDKLKNDPTIEPASRKVLPVVENPDTASPAAMPTRTPLHNRASQVTATLHDKLPVTQDTGTFDAASVPPRVASVEKSDKPTPSHAAEPMTVPGAAPRPAPQTAPDPQLEALRLSAEAAAAMSRLYLQCLTHAAQANPLALALRGQVVMSQWMATMLGAQVAPLPPAKD